MQLKPGVNKTDVSPQIWFALGVAALLSDTYRGCELVITALRDGQHMSGSLHYQGQAADLRTIGCTETANVSYYNALRYCLRPLGYDVMLETDPPHIHIEYDPKPGRDFTKHWGAVPLEASDAPPAGEVKS